MHTKTPDDIRREVRRHLNLLPAADKQALSDRAIERFVRTPEFRRARHVGLYFPVRHELDILPLLDACQAKNKRIYLPCLYPNPFQKLYYLPFDEKANLTLNRFGIPEPDHAMVKRISLLKLDLVITPLSAFGAQGERLGAGGGFYDRTFAYRANPGLIGRPRLWAIALDAQRYPLTSNAWDVPIDGVATETGITRFKRT